VQRYLRNWWLRLHWLAHARRADLRWVRHTFLERASCVRPTSRSRWPCGSRSGP
jgi:hypothetical protein